MPDPADSRLLAIAVTDLVGSVALKNDLGDRAYLALIRAHDEIIRAVVGGVPGARLLNDTGDGKVLGFEDGADAVRSSLEIQRRMRAHDWGAIAEGVAVGVRIGVSMGRVRFIDDPEPGRLPKVVGLPVDIAARVMGQSPAGAVGVTGAVYDDAETDLRDRLPGGGYVAWSDLGAIDLKGRPHPERVYCAAEQDAPASGVRVVTSGPGVRKAESVRTAVALSIASLVPVVGLWIALPPARPEITAPVAAGAMLVGTALFRRVRTGPALAAALALLFFASAMGYWATHALCTLPSARDSRTPLVLGFHMNAWSFLPGPRDKIFTPGALPVAADTPHDVMMAFNGYAGQESVMSIWKPWTVFAVATILIVLFAGFAFVTTGVARIVWRLFAPAGGAGPA